MAMPDGDGDGAGGAEQVTGTTMAVGTPVFNSLLQL